MCATGLTYLVLLDLVALFNLLSLSFYLNYFIFWNVSQLYSAFNRGGNQEMSVQPEQHLSRIAGVTADSGMSQQR
jgi:hypothetical protein